jgi:hypothetical protein
MQLTLTLLSGEGSSTARYSFSTVAVRLSATTSLPTP